MITVSVVHYTCFHQLLVYLVAPSWNLARRIREQVMLVSNQVRQGIQHNPVIFASEQKVPTLALSGTPRPITRVQDADDGEEILEFFKSHLPQNRRNSCSEALMRPPRCAAAFSSSSNKSSPGILRCTAELRRSRPRVYYNKFSHRNSIAEVVNLYTPKKVCNKK